MTNQSVSKIDAIKLALEFKHSVDLRRIFNHMATDASNLYKITGVVQAQALADNYKAEFLKEIREIMRKSLKQFGFFIRKTLQANFDISFGIENKLIEIDLDFKEAQLTDGTEKQDEINSAFLLAASLFVANESEKQVNFITDTNVKDIESAFAISGALFLNKLNEANNSGDQKKVEKLKNNQRKIIAENAKKDIINKGKARSALIAEQNVGLTESWARQEEAKLINDAELIGKQDKVIKLKKVWNAILDNKTRPAHVVADGQTTGISNFFLVGGEQLLAPRMGSLASNNLRCRCQAEHLII